MLGVQSSCSGIKECRVVTTVFLMCQERHKFPDVEEVPTAGLNLLATMGGYFVEEIEEVEETVEGGVEKEAEDVGQSENDSMAMVLYGKPTAYVLPSEVVCLIKNLKPW